MLNPSSMGQSVSCSMELKTARACLKQLVVKHLQSGSREKLLHSSLPPQLFFTVQEMITPTTQMGLPPLINVIKVIPHVHSNYPR